MNFSATTNRLKRCVSGALLVCGLISGAANADIDPNSLFLIATDSARNGSGEAYVLDLNLDILVSDPSSFGGVTDAALAAWLNDPSATTITWGVFGVGRNDAGATSSEVRVASTVNPSSVEPERFGQSSIFQATTRGKDVIGKFNNAHTEDGLAVPSGDAAFPSDFGHNWDGNAQFVSTGGLDDLLPMYIFEVNGSFQPVAPLALEGLWSLNAVTGTVAFSAVPLPAAVWMLGSALLGVFGIRRRQSAG